MAFGEPNEVGLSSINVTPLTDVLLVLLITFLLTAPAFDTSREEVPLPRVSSFETLEASMEILTLANRVGTTAASGMVSAEEIDRESLTLLKQRSPHEVLGLAVERSVPYEDLYKVVRQAELAGWTSLVLLTEPKP